MYGIILSSKLIIPNWTDLINGDEVEEDLAEEEEELPESPTWAPNTWKRAHWPGPASRYLGTATSFT